MSALLELNDIVVRFGGVTALDRVSFRVQSGGITALIGPNGAGKTTCFNAISGLQSLAAGRVTFAGRDITRLPPERRRGLSRTFQIVQIFGELTARENVMLGYHAQLRGGMLRSGLGVPRIRRQERWVNEQTTALLQEMRLEAIAEQRAATLPLGQQRLLELARAVAGDPQLLLLDEAASGLSAAELDGFVAHVERLRDSGCTVLLVEHNMRFVRRLAQHLVVLQHGQLIFDGRLADGMQDPGVVAAYLGTKDAPHA